MRITMRMNMRIWWGWSEYGKDILVLSGSPNQSQAIWLHLSWWWCSFKKLSFHRSGSAEISWNLFAKLHLRTKTLNALRQCCNRTHYYSIIQECNKQKASVFCKVGPAYVSGQKLSQGWTLFILCNCETQLLTDQTHKEPTLPDHFSTLWRSTPYKQNIFWNLMTPSIHWLTDHSPITHTDPPSPPYGLLSLAQFTMSSYQDAFDADCLHDWITIRWWF